MAGALSYQHVKLTLNLSSLFNQYEKYEVSLQDLYTNLSKSDPHYVLSKGTLFRLQLKHPHLFSTTQSGHS